MAIIDSCLCSAKACTFALLSGLAIHSGVTKIRFVSLSMDRTLSSIFKSSWAEPKYDAFMCCSSQFFTWSCIRLMVGVITRDFLFSYTAGNLKQSDFPLPVG